MNLFKKAFGDNPSSGREKALELTRQAFRQVEQGRADSAIQLLHKAIELDPQLADAHNELAFIQGKMKRDLKQAEDHAWDAVASDPLNDKFYHAVQGICRDRAQQAGTRRKLRAGMSEPLQDVERRISAYPRNFLLHARKAVILASYGEPRQKWEDELQQANQLFRQVNASATGVPTNTYLLKKVLTQITSICDQVASYYENLVEG